MMMFETRKIKGLAAGGYPLPQNGVQLAGPRHEPAPLQHAVPHKEDFTPLDAKNVRMYVCGPTVYDFAHIGNARPAIVFDVLFRLLRHTYGEAHVTYVRNITDIDDKINARAAAEGITIRELTEKTYGVYNEDVAALGCLPPTHHAARDRTRFADDRDDRDVDRKWPRL